MFAAIGVRSEIAVMLVDKEGGKRDRLGRTALILAVNNCNKEIVELLYDVERDITDNQNRGVEHYALNSGNDEMLKIIITADALSVSGIGL